MKCRIIYILLYISCNYDNAILRPQFNLRPSPLFNDLIRPIGMRGKRFDTPANRVPSNDSLSGGENRRKVASTGYTLELDAFPLIFLNIPINLFFIKKIRININFYIII